MEIRKTRLDWPLLAVGFVKRDQALIEIRWLTKVAQTDETYANGNDESCRDCHIRHEPTSLWQQRNNFSCWHLSQSRLAFLQGKREPELFPSCFGLEKVTSDALKLVPCKFTGNVLLDDVVYRQVKLLRILRICQKSQLYLFLFNFSQLPKEVPSQLIVSVLIDGSPPLKEPLPTMGFECSFVTRFPPVHSRTHSTRCARM